jgi:hypothetical protein
VEVKEPSGDRVRESPISCAVAARRPHRLSQTASHQSGNRG